MSNELYNHSRTIDPNMNIMAPSAKVPKTDMGPYPGGVPYITDKYLSPAGRINNTVGWRTNGSIRATVNTRTRDQKRVNADQFVWMDVRDYDKPLLLNLQQLNSILLSDEISDIFNDASGTALGDSIKHTASKKFSLTGDPIVNREELQKAYILTNFKLFGVVVNRDVDTDNNINMERVSRSFTTTVRGVVNVLDYWSRNDRILKPYDSCYFVLKKVLIDKSMRLQPNLTSTKHGAGLPVPIERHEKMCWQVVPEFSSDTILPMEKYTFKVFNRDTMIHETHVGHYWGVGNIHEYPDIGHASMFAKRGEMSVAHDITYLHDNGRTKPLHFYLKFNSMKLL